MQKYGILTLILSVCCVFSSFAQARYKHLPRARVITHHINSSEVKENLCLPVMMPVTEHPPHLPNRRQINFTDSSILNVQDKPVCFHPPVVSHHHPHSPVKWSKPLKITTHLSDIKDADKTSIYRWMLFMIILYALALILIILA